MNVLKKILKAIFVKDKPAPIDEQLVLFLQATWAQKQLDDLLLMNESVKMSLAKKPYDVGYLSKRDKIHHDINTIQPIVAELGIAAGLIIEKKFNVRFAIMTGKNLPVKPVVEGATPQNTNNVATMTPNKKIILPGQ